VISMDGGRKFDIQWLKRRNQGHRAQNPSTSVMGMLRQLSLRDTANSSAFIDLPLHRA